VPSLERAAVSRRLMDPEHLQAEQVGFLDLRAWPVRLDMMGGEFCGNACRAAAAVMAMEGIGLAGDGGVLAGELSVSGAVRAVRERAEPGTGVCWAEMPLPRSDHARGVPAAHDCGPGLGKVRLPGITHLCVDESLHPFPADCADEAARLRQRFELDAEAVGCIWYRTHPIPAIRPVVWVRGTDTTHLETGCGSGSLALALWLGRGQNFPLVQDILQPSGVPIGVRVEVETAEITAWIHGPVSLVATGRVNVSASSGWPSG